MRRPRWAVFLVLLLVLEASGACGDDGDNDTALAGWIVLPDGREAATIRTTKGVRKAPGPGTLFARRIITPA